VTTVLFPIFASYKALRTSDPAQLTPWLMYWVILSLALLAESTFSFILTWVPMYAWIRLGVHIYLVLPGKQGATQLYQTHVHPFLAEHESDIDKWISNAHESAKSAGLNYLKRFIEWFKVTALGMEPRPRTPPVSRQGSYAQQLLSRFNLPTARDGLAAPAGDFVGLLASALQMTTSSGASREVQAEDLSASGTLIPADIHSNEERMNYVSTQRERLRVLLQAFDNEAFNLASAPADMAREKSSDNLSKSRSEADFDKIEKEEIHGAGKPAQAGWMPWNWTPAKAASVASALENTARASGVDLGH
jgi:receptor expression-enhancing protein 1/2/3/4